MRKNAWPNLAGLTVVLAVALAVIFGALRGSGSSGASAAPLVKHAAPEFELKDVDGRHVALRKADGRPVLLNFFATWCVPCASEMPMINRLYRSHPEAFSVLAIDKQEPGGDVRTFVQALHLSFRPLLDSGGDVFRLYRVNVQPVSFWLDRKGVIRAIHYGAMSEGYARKELRLLGGA